ncbi:MAG TPA: hypothetical protein VFF73_25215 [Planctomycetota bacterium]|nr:hypothetical protein [Planctomycetota bacterium]
MNRVDTTLACVLVGAAVGVAACGGGGGGGGGGGVPLSPPAPPGSPPPPPPPGNPPPPPPPPGSNPALPDQAGALPVPSQVFPATDAWNTDISGYPLNAMSATYINSIGLNTAVHADFGTTYQGVPNGINYIVVAGTQAKVPIDFLLYGSESDPGPYPFPPNAPIEGFNPGQIPPQNGGGDQHTLVIDKDNMILYESAGTFPPNAPNSYGATDPNWCAACGAKWDLTKPIAGQRPIHWTSADAAGLPIFAGLVRYDEAVTKGVINHALRFTVNSSQNGFISPASHQAGVADTTLPPMGLRVRLKASTVITSYPPEVQVILTALKKYGMVVADNGSSWYISGAPDSRWSDSNLHTLGQLHGSDFEVVDTGAIQQ